MSPTARLENARLPARLGYVGFSLRLRMLTASYGGFLVRLRMLRGGE